MKNGKKLVIGLVALVLIVSAVAFTSGDGLQGFLNFNDFRTKRVTTEIQSPFSLIPVDDRLANSATRGGTLKALTNALHVYTPDCTTARYPDLSIDASSCPAIEAGVELGWVAGYADGMFHADQGMTRAELVRLATNAFDVEPITTDDSDAAWYDTYVDALDTYPDLGGHWVQNDVLALVELEVLNGIGTFKPDTRATVKFRNTLIDRLSDIYFNFDDAVIVRLFSEDTGYDLQFLGDPIDSSLTGPRGVVSAFGISSVSEDGQAVVEYSDSLRDDLSSDFAQEDILRLDPNIDASGGVGAPGPVYVKAYRIDSYGEADRGSMDLAVLQK